MVAVRGKLSRLCGTLLLAASIAALGAGVANAQQQGNELESLNQQILDNPQDVDLNLRYARAAEEEGSPRLALVAYERILINDPTNEEARRGYERIRRQIEPGYTVARVEVGARYDTNAVNANADVLFVDPDELEATTYYARLLVANESEFAGHRWRSTLNIDLEQTPDIDQLDYKYFGVQTGPILYAGPHLAVIPSIGASAAWLGDDPYYTEGNLNVTVEGRMSGASYWARARVGYRDYDPDNFFFLLGCAGARDGGQNLSKWCNKEFDDRLNKAKTLTNKAERTKLYEKAQDIFAAQAPAFLLAHSQVYTVARKSVSGYLMDPLGIHRFDGVDKAE